MASVITRFLPREQSFFPMFNEVAANICESAQALSGLLMTGSPVPERLKNWNTRAMISLTRSLPS
jgi:hypothetical protein